MKYGHLLSVRLVACGVAGAVVGSLSAPMMTADQAIVCAIVVAAVWTISGLFRTDAA